MILGTTVMIYLSLAMYMYFEFLVFFMWRKPWKVNSMIIDGWHAHLGCLLHLKEHIRRIKRTINSFILRSVHIPFIQQLIHPPNPSILVFSYKQKEWKWNEKILLFYRNHEHVHLWAVQTMVISITFPLKQISKLQPLTFFLKQNRTFGNCNSM